jgi:hypothetical protein
VLAFRHGDGANQLGDLGPEPRGLAAAYQDWTGYRPANPLARLLDPNRWQPLPTPDGMEQRFLVPHWGLVAPFALQAGWELRPAGPRLHPGRSYLFQAEEVLADSAGLTDEHKATAEYWADGPGRRPRRATGACTPGRSRPGTATASTRTSSCSSPSRRRCWTPASPAGRQAGL